MIQTGQVALACEYLSPRLVPEAKPILQLVKLGLGETPIYRERNRNTSSRLAQDAEVIIGSHLEKNGVAASLERSFPLARMSAQPYSGRDNVDLRVQLNTSIKLNIVIEFDTIRADQVAKKFVSRVAILGRPELIYVAFCYPGTQAMSLPEVLKYFSFMRIIAADLGLSGLIGIVPTRGS